MAEELVITVASKKAKEKGGFDIFDTLGNKYLLSGKNINLADALIEGRASKISAAKTSYGTYINSAVLFDGLPPPEKRIEPITAGVENVSPLSKEAIKLGAEPIPNTKDTRIRSMSLAYSKDLVVAGKVELGHLTKYADKFIDYILSIKRKED